MEDALFERTCPNQVASIIKISQADSATMQALANNRDIFWQDKRAYLNQAFKEAKSKLPG